ncbi:MAG TPA: sugar phosphate isomerase/epimerase family protein [Spirochaetia bacterium]|nr:sugar phosphate isomerase/epimerase family protein [Spirochaetia bacterium]
MTKAIEDLSRMCIHTATTRPWSIEIAVEEYARSGVAGITVWRDAIAGKDAGVVGRKVRDAGMEVVSLCRGGFFAAADIEERRRRVADNLQAVREASALGAPHIVLVCGADPAQPLADSREQIVDGIAAVAAAAREAGVRLAIEPLHPMYADSRSAVNTLEQANQMCDLIDSPSVGIAVDVYHLFWDPHLEQEIARCGASGRLFAFHVCDWRTPTRDLLNDRGLMGDGCIPIREIRGWVEKASFTGFNEVEVFSTEYWSQDQSQYLRKIIEAYKAHV